MLADVTRTFEDRTPAASDNFPRTMQNRRVLRRDVVRFEISKLGFHCGPSIFWNQATFQRSRFAARQLKLDAANASFFLVNFPIFRVCATRSQTECPISDITSLQRAIAHAGPRCNPRPCRRLLLMSNRSLSAWPLDCCLLSPPRLLFGCSREIRACSIGVHAVLLHWCLPQLHFALITSPRGERCGLTLLSR